jgi:hypothetical protein
LGAFTGEDGLCREKVEHLAKGYQMVSVEELEEGDLPRKLFLVALRKSGNLAS